MSRVLSVRWLVSKSNARVKTHGNSHLRLTVHWKSTPTRTCLHRPPSTTFDHLTTPFHNHCGLEINTYQDLPPPTTLDHLTTFDHRFAITVGWKSTPSTYQDYLCPLPHPIRVSCFSILCGFYQCFYLGTSLPDCPFSIHCGF